MSKPRLGFKLWFWKYKKVFVQNLFLWIKSLNGVATLVLAILGIFLATRGNNIAKASYELSKNDTSQQAQINKLNDISFAQKMQVDTLVEIVKELRKIKQNSEGITQQTQLISTNAQPTFKIIEYNPQINEKGEIEFWLNCKNIGQRTANEVNCFSILINYAKSTIISHEILKDKRERTTVNLAPSQEMNYSFISTSTQKHVDFNNIIIVLRFVYFDNALSKADTSTFFLKNNIAVDYPESWDDIGGTLKKKIEGYLRTKKL